MKIPAKITAGDTVSWTEDATAAADGTSIGSADYGLSFSFRGTGSGINVTGSASGTGWQLSLNATQTAAMNTTGALAQWYWQAYATKTSDSTRRQVGDGRLIVLPNFAALTDNAFDGRSQAEKNLAAIETEINARITGSLTVEYTIGNRSLKKEPMTELLKLRSNLRLQVARERAAQSAANGLGNPSVAGIRFTR